MVSPTDTVESLPPQAGTRSAMVSPADRAIWRSESNRARSASAVLSDDAWSEAASDVRRGRGFALTPGGAREWQWVRDVSNEHVAACEEAEALLNPRDDVEEMLSMETRLHCELGESIWEGALLIGIPGIGTTSSLVIALCLVTNVFVQLLFCYIVSVSLTYPRFISNGFISNGFIS